MVAKSRAIVPALKMVPLTSSIDPEGHPHTNADKEGDARTEERLRSRPKKGLGAMTA